tara:strand:+ start:4864 stop:4977 length:114 start_codon:yes stop_codon:yes gene_type:complete
VNNDIMKIRREIDSIVKMLNDLKDRVEKLEKKIERSE